MVIEFPLKPFVLIFQTYAFILCNMAARKVSPDSSEEDLNFAINNLCRGNLKLFIKH